MSVEVEERRAQTIASREAAAQEHDRGGALASAASALSDARLLLIALWLGAAVFFSAAVAPSAFAVLRASGVAHASELAGAIVNRTLSIVNTGGFIISLLLIASAFLFRRTARARAFYAEVISLGIVAVATGAGQWIIAAQMQRLRAAMGRPVEEVMQSDPLRVAFNNLHGYSVAALAIGIVAAVVALLAIARRARSRLSH